MNVSRELTRIARQVVAEDTPIEKQIGNAQHALAALLKPILGLQPSFKISKSARGHLIFTDDIGQSAQGIFASVFSSVTVEVVVTTKEQVSDGTYWGRVSLNWEHKDGGSNGTDVATVWFNPVSQDWMIRPGR